MCRFVNISKGIILKVIIIALALLWTGTVYSQANISSSISFNPADGTRTWMDLGGAWDGSTDVSATTGDSFILSINNTGTDSAYDLVTSFTLPTGLNLVGTGSVSASGAGCGAAPSVSLSQGGTTVTVGYTPSGYDLPQNCEIQITMGAVSTTSIPLGNNDVIGNFQFAPTNGGGLGSNQTEQVTFEVRQGEVLPSKNDIDIEAAVGEDVTIDILACNEGDGGLFDVVIDDSLVNPNTANSLQVSSLTQTTPASPSSVLAFPIRTLPYLAPGECFTVRTVSNVTGCSEIDHTANVRHRTDLTDQEVFSFQPHPGPGGRNR